MDTYPEQKPRGVRVPVSRRLAAVETMPCIRGIERVSRIHARSLHRAPGPDREEPV